MGNLPPCKVAGIREIIRAAGAGILDLPPCSPDLDLIEQVLAKPRPGSARPMPGPGRCLGHARCAACRLQPEPVSKRPVRSGLRVRMNLECSNMEARR